MSVALNYFKYLLKAKTKHGIHSPFVFDIVTKVFEDKTRFSEYNDIEKLRKQLLEDERLIKVTDLGAGSKTQKSSHRKIKHICKSAEKSKKYAQLLFRIVRYFEPNKILELGTSLGVTTLYLANGNKNAKVFTIEGCPQTAAIAQQNFDKQQAHNIKLITGNFDEVLSATLQTHFSKSENRADEISLFFFDGNHRKQATLNYFNQCLQYANNNAVFVFDDINWSDDMRKAWATIKTHPRVTVTIDLFFMGIVFLRTEQAKQNFVLKF